mgnify:CR=1 FL=1
MKTLKLALLANLCLLFLSTESSGQTIDGHADVISLQRCYSQSIPVPLKARLDSTIQVTVDRFNKDLHTFSVAINDSSSAHNIKLDITKGKLATKKQRNIAYLVNLIVPVYIPMHKIKSSIELPVDVTTSKVGLVNSSAHILVGNIAKREDKLLQKYADKLLHELNTMDVQRRPELRSSIQ